MFEIRCCFVARLVFVVILTRKISLESQKLTDGQIDVTQVA